MRYFHEEKSIISDMYGEVYYCEKHPVYTKCTLYKIGEKGLAVIQQRYNPETKMTWWEEIDKTLKDEIYLHPNFKEYFETRADECDINGVYPTVSLRQIMWALRMKPLKKERWETVFDRRDI